MVRAAAARVKGDALGAHLQPLGDGFEAEFQGDCAAIPFHKRRINFGDFVAINAHHLGYFRGAAAGGKIKFLARANINFA